MDCQTCKERQKQAEPVPFIVHEADMARMERNNKRLWIALILVIVLLVGSNIAWTVYENQYEDVVEETYTSEADGGGSYARGRGRNAGRDPLGRYSRDGDYRRGYSRDAREDYRERLMKLMDEAPDENTRQSIGRMMQSI